MISDKTLFVAGGLMLGTLAAWVVVKGAAGVGASLGGGAVSAIDGAASGAVKTVASVFGIPDTDATRCKAAQAAGNQWDASKYCPLADFLRGVFK